MTVKLEKTTVFPNEEECEGCCDWVACNCASVPKFRRIKTEEIDQIVCLNHTLWIKAMLTEVRNHEE